MPARPLPPADGKRPHVVVLGGGFGGLEAVRTLRGAPVDVTLVDRRNHHLFQPLLYEVATAALAPSEIAQPLRRIFRGQGNVRVRLADATGIDLERRRVALEDVELDWDALVVATGSRDHYFGHDDWADLAPGLKSIEDAVAIRRRFLLAFERADQCPDAAERARLLTSVIVGGGPTGIELAGTMAEVARRVLRDDYRHVRTEDVHVVLAEGGPRLLAAYPPELSERARRDLERLGVDVRLDALVTGLTERHVELEDGTRIPSGHVVWAAGVRGAAPAGLEPWLRRDGRIAVEADLCLPGHPDVFVIGDLAWAVEAGREAPVPALAPAAMQMGRYVGERIAAEARGAAHAEERPPFRYTDRGMLATIGRGKAVAVLGRFRFAGPVAWMLWVVIHIFFLIGFRSKVLVMIEWAYAYVTFHRGARLITGSAPSSQRSDRRDTGHAAEGAAAARGSRAPAGPQRRPL